jgi:hypothetical protein
VQRSSGIPRTTANDFDETPVCPQFLGFQTALNSKFGDQNRRAGNRATDEIFKTRGAFAKWLLDPAIAVRRRVPF